MARAIVVRVPLAYISSSVPRGVCAVGGIEALANAARYGLSCASVHCAAAAMSVGPFCFRRVRSLSGGALFSLYVRVRSQSLAVRSTRTQA